MGAEVESKYYMPFTMRDLNAGANGSWPRYIEDNAMRGDPYGAYVLRTADGQTEFDREMLKRTILEHEAVFRKQVYELHRVYRIQKDLMRSFGHKDPAGADTSGTDSFASRLPDDRNAPWRLHGKSPIVKAEESKQSARFCREGSVQSSVAGLPASDNLQKQKKKMDRAPVPTLYIDSESAETAEKADNDDGFHSFRQDLRLPGGAELPLCAEGSSRKRRGNEEVISAARKKLLGDLNDPFAAGVRDVPRAFSALPSNGNSSASWHDSALRRGSSSYFHYPAPQDDGMTARNMNLFSSFFPNAVQSDVADAGLKKSSYGVLPLDRSNAWFSRGAAAGDAEAAAVQQRNQLAQFDCSGQLNPWSLHSSYSAASGMNHSSPAPPMFFSSANPKSNGASFFNPESAAVFPSLGLGAELVPQARERSDAGCGKGFDLNIATDVGVSSPENNCEDPVSVLPWIAKRPADAAAVCAEHDGGSHRGGSMEAAKERIFIDLNEEIPDEEDVQASTVEEHAAAAVLELDLNIEQESEASDSLEFLAAGAADTIIAMAAFVEPCSGEPDASGALQWLAELAASSTAAAEEEDYETSFECMVLKLEAVSQEECCNPRVESSGGGVGGGEGGLNSSSLLASKPRRGQGRKRRGKKRDFQKDIMPGLVSLNRNDVVEDIQMLMVMMEAVGEPWDAGAAAVKRMSSSGGRPRVRRRQRAAAAAAAEAEAAVVTAPPPSPPAAAAVGDLESDGLGMMGWGRTRRCRRLRCPTGAAAAGSGSGGGRTSVLTN